MGVFYVIERRQWQTGALVILLLVAGWLYFAAGGRQDDPAADRLVFAPQFRPGASEALPAAAPLEQPPRGESGQVRVDASRPGLYDGYRIEREKARAREIEMLESLMSEQTLGESERQAAQARLLELLERGEKEAQAEQLLRARGLPDAVVLMGDGGVSVVVPLLLTRDEVARIGDVVARVVGLPLERITVLDGSRQP
ncbi:MAG TPA: SpoIIIAH-like family protein [Limnochordia bacterium]